MPKMWSRLETYVRKKSVGPHDELGGIYRKKGLCPLKARQKKKKEDVELRIDLVILFFKTKKIKLTKYENKIKYDKFLYYPRCRRQYGRSV